MRAKFWLEGKRLMETSDVHNSGKRETNQMQADILLFG